MPKVLLWFCGAVFCGSAIIFMYSFDLCSNIFRIASLLWDTVNPQCLWCNPERHGYNWTLSVYNKTETNTQTVWVTLVLNEWLILNTLRPRQNGRHFADDIFKCIFLNENIWIWLTISLKFVPEVRINNIPALVEIMAWRRSGDKPLSATMMVSLLTHIWVTPPQWVKPRLGLSSPHILKYLPPA